MARSPSPRRAGALTAIALIVAALLVFAPSLISTWIGGMIGQVWAAAIGAVAALLSAMLGAASILP